MLFKELAALHSSCLGFGYHAQVTCLACTSCNLSPDGVVGGMVLRVDTAALPKPKQKTHRAAEALDAHNRGNMMKRIQAGGSGASGHAKAAVSYLNKNRTGSDEDAPLVICEGDMMFEDGWAANALQGATFGEPALLRHEEDVDEPSRSKVLSDVVAEAAVVGEKRQRMEITDKVVRDRLGDSSSEDASCSSSGNSSGGEKASHKEAKRHKRKRDKKKHEKSDKKGRRTRRRKEKKERERTKRHEKR